MIIVAKKYEVIGIVKTGHGNFYQIGRAEDARKQHIGTYRDCYQFHVIDDEGFENYIWVSGEFVVIPLVVSEYREVKVVLTDKEAQALDTAELFSDEPVVSE